MAVVSCTISSGQSLSAAADLGAFSLTAIVTPTAWDPADLTFQISVDAGVNFFNFYAIGKFTETVVPCQPSIFYNLVVLQLPKNLQVKLRSGSSTQPRIQSANRVFSLITV